MALKGLKSQKYGGRDPLGIDEAGAAY